MKNLMRKLIIWHCKKYICALYKYNNLKSQIVPLLFLSLNENIFNSGHDCRIIWYDSYSFFPLNITLLSTKEKKCLIKAPRFITVVLQVIINVSAKIIVCTAGF